jgi:hypothetical protein
MSILWTERARKGHVLLFQLYQKFGGKPFTDPFFLRFRLFAVFLRLTDNRQVAGFENP